uniref:Putative secreted protein n=1 Tax=Ixodes ricinus TaxID=34613 RepID=A0A6B0TTP6_IXORI
MLAFTNALLIIILIITQPRQHTILWRYSPRFGKVVLVVSIFTLYRENCAGTILVLQCRWDICYFEVMHP